MKNGIPEQCYYDLLVWKDDNLDIFKSIVTLFGKDYTSLGHLNKNELERLYFLVFNKMLTNNIEEYKFEIHQPAFNRNLVIKDKNDNVLHESKQFHPDGVIFTDFNNTRFIVEKAGFDVMKYIETATLIEE